MSEEPPSESELCEAIVAATRKAVKQLFVEHPGEYYYLTLVTSGEAYSPVVAAWSKEALSAAMARPQGGSDPDDLKWSYADSPYYCYGKEHFSRVEELFNARPQIDSVEDVAWLAEYELRLRAMEAALAQLDRQGLFGERKDRGGMLINVEVAPPDLSNTLRACRLNPQNGRSFREWIEEAAEME